MIPASHAAIIIPGAIPGPLLDEPHPIPQVLERAMQERVVVWQDGAWQDGAWQDGAGKAPPTATPPRTSPPRSSSVTKWRLWFIWNRVDAEYRFDEGHLQLLTAVAGMAAVAWENATILGWLQEENERLQSELKIEHGMVGVSDKLRELQRQIAKVAPSNSNVLILGESGTGKELIARALHRNSLRAAGPFVAINCAALTETLLESELFGHERGAFTGAITQKKGKLEVADGGTVFLDEIGELSPLLQAKLLRVLQEREMERVGGTKTIQLNIRLLAATNRDLGQAVQKGDFRRDLLLPLERGVAQGASVARASRRYVAAGRAFRQEVCRRVRPQNCRPGAAKREPTCKATPGPATFASWKMLSSAPWCWVRPIWFWPKICPSTSANRAQQPSRPACTKKPWKRPSARWCCRLSIR